MNLVVPVGLPDFGNLYGYRLSNGLEIPSMPRRARQPLLVNLSLVAVLAAIVYVFSYAPYVRLRGGVRFADVHWTSRTTPVEHYGDGRDYRMYQPVDWLIDHTPLRYPLFCWAELLGVRTDFEIAYDDRTLAARLNELP